MPKAYWVTCYHSISDERKLAAYAALGGVAITEGGGRILARGVAALAYENGLKQRTVIIEFDRVEAAQKVHDSAGYQAALQALGDGAVRDLRVVEGVA